MAGLHADSWVDLVAFTMKKYGRFKATDLTTDIQRHLALSELMKTNRMGFDSGIGIVFNMIRDQSYAARNKGLMQTDPNANIPDVGLQGTVPWRHTDTNWSFEEVSAAMNGTPERVLEMVRTQEHISMMSLNALMEANWWGKPTSSTDEDTPFGLKYWVTASGTAAVGFNGVDPSGFTDGRGGKSSTTYPRWANCTFTYTHVTDDDLVEKMRQAAYTCDFRPPVNIVPGYGTGTSIAYYTVWTKWSALNKLLRMQNENLGTDLDSYAGVLRFQRNPVHAVPFLDQNNTYPVNPVYGIDWSVFKTMFLQGEFLKRRGPFRSPTQHTVHTTWIDCTYNWICYDLRKQFVGCTSSTT